MLTGILNWINIIINYHSENCSHLNFSIPSRLRPIFALDKIRKYSLFIKFIVHVYYTPIKLTLLKGAKLHTNVKCKSESVANKITLIILHAAVLKCLIELNSLLHGGLQKKICS